MSEVVGGSEAAHDSVANPMFHPPDSPVAASAAASVAEPAAAVPPVAPMCEPSAPPLNPLLEGVGSPAEPPAPSPNVFFFGAAPPSPVAVLSAGGPGDSMFKKFTDWDEPKPCSQVTGVAEAVLAAPPATTAATAPPPRCQINVGMSLQRARHSLAGHRDGTWVLHDTTDGLGPTDSSALCLSVKESGGGGICWQGSVTKTAAGLTLEDDSGLPGTPFATIEQLVVHYSTHRYGSGTTTLLSQLQAGNDADKDAGTDSGQLLVSGPGTFGAPGPSEHGGGGASTIRAMDTSDMELELDLEPPRGGPRSPIVRSPTIASHRGLAKERLAKERRDMATAASDRPVHASLDTLKHEEEQQRDADDHGIKQISGGGVAETPDGGMKENQKESTATAIVPIKTQKTHMMLRGPALALYFVFLYFVIGVLFYTQQMEWDVDFTLYFIVIVITTVGYGDHDDIETDGQKLFTAVYVFVGVALVMTSITLIIAAVQRKRAILKAKVQQRAIEHILHMSEGEDGPPTPGVSVDGPGGQKSKGKNKQKGAEKGAEKARKLRDPSKFRPSWSDQMWNFSRVYPICRAALFVVVVALIGVAWGMQSDEDWSFVEALYWVIITGTTVGFGDYHPTYSGSYWFAMVYIFALVIVMGNLLNNISERLIYGDVERHRVDSKNTTSLVHDELLLAQNAAGSVDKAEWLRAVLVALGQVDPVLCDIILSYFDKLDYDSDGLLTSDELERAIERTPLPESELDQIENSVGYLSSLFSQLDYIGVNHRDTVVASKKVPERRIGMRKGMGF